MKKFLDVVLFFVTFLDFTLVGSVSVDLENEGIEYCQLDSFNPKCSQNEVIYMEKALFGRIRKGRCITEEDVKGFGSLIHDPKYIGCYSDVLYIFHERCSFRQECNVKIADESLKKLSTCLPGLFLNLEAKFTCLTTYYSEDNSCHLLVSEKPKYFLSEFLKNERCGSRTRPFILEAPKGQRVSVKLVEISDTKFRNGCESFGIIFQDGFSGNNSTLCSSDSDWSVNQNSKNPHPYKSSKNTVKMFVMDLNVSQKKFALMMKAEGCLDVIPPEDTWLKRTNDDIVIGCYSSKQTWYLRCEDGHWTGTVGNCSSYVEINRPNNEEVEKSAGDKLLMPKNQQILAIVSICGAGVVICSLIICVGAVCSKRYSLLNKTGKLKFTNPSATAFEPSYVQQQQQQQHQHHTYHPGLQVFSDSGFDGGQLIKDKHEFATASEDDKTYFVLEENRNDEDN